MQQLTSLVLVAPDNGCFRVRVSNGRLHELVQRLTNSVKLVC